MAVKNLKKKVFRVDSNGILYTLNLIKIHPAVLNLNHVDRQTHMASPARIPFMSTVKKSRKTTMKMMNKCSSFNLVLEEDPYYPSEH